MAWSDQHAFSARIWQIMEQQSKYSSNNAHKRKIFVHTSYNLMVVQTSKRTRFKRIQRDILASSN